MKLAPHEIATPLWQKLVDHYTPILAKHRARLENTSISEAESIKLRWQIATIKELFDLAEPDRRKANDAGE